MCVCVTPVSLLLTPSLPKTMCPRCSPLNSYKENLTERLGRPETFRSWNMASLDHAQEQSAFNQDVPSRLFATWETLCCGRRVCVCVCVCVVCCVCVCVCVTTLPSPFSSQQTTSHRCPSRWWNHSVWGAVVLYLELLLPPPLPASPQMISMIN